MKHNVGRLGLLSGLVLLASNGSLSAVGADVSPLYPDSGIEYHLDASASELNKTLFLDDDYGVTNWMSKADPVSGVTVEFKPGDGTFAPRWLPDFGDGHPAIYFGTDPVGCTSVWTCLKGPAVRMTHRSCFFVFASTNTAPGYAVFYSAETYGSPQMYLGDSGGNASSAVDYRIARRYSRWIMDSTFMHRIDYNGVNVVNFPETTVSYRNGTAQFASNEMQLMYCVLGDVTSPFVGPWGYWMCFGNSMRPDHKTKGWRGPFREVLVYNRDLTESEIEQVTAYLRAKWFAKGEPSYWIGGASGNWEAAANWSKGIPGKNGENAAIVTNAAEITVNGSLAIHDFIATENGTLKLKGGKLSLGGSFVTPAAYQVEVTGDADWVLKDRALLRLPQLTATGKISVAGGGKIKFLAPLTGAPAFELRDAKLDVYGQSLTFSSLLAGVVTNTAAEIATVKVSVPAGKTGWLSAQPLSTISFEAEGDVKVVGTLVDSDCLRIGKGNVSVVTNLPAAAIPGLAFHLDASDGSSFSTNAAGRLIEWWSSLPEGNYVVFTNSHVGETVTYVSTSYPVNTPIYQPHCCNGKPGFMFGRDENDQGEYSSMLATGYGVTYRTLVAVLVPTNHAAATGGFDRIFGSGDTSRGFQFYDHASTYVTYYPEDSGVQFANVAVNGKPEYTNSVWIGGSRSEHRHDFKPQIVICDRSSKLSVYNPTFVYETQGKSAKNMRAYNGALSEMLLYDRQLSEMEKEALVASLMEKWGIGADAVFGGYEANPTNLTYDVSGGLGTLSFAGELAVTNTTLSFVNGRPSAGKFLTTGGALTGPFAAVTGTHKSINYHSNSATIANGLVIILR